MKLKNKTPPRRRQRGSALPREWVDSLPARGARTRRVRNGRLELVKRPDSAMRRPLKVAVTTGLDSKAVRGELDQRFAFGRLVTKYAQEYRSHVASDTVVMDDLCRSAAVHKVIYNLALTRMNGEPFDDMDEARAVYHALRRADADLRSVLSLLGVKRAEKPVLSLDEYVQQKSREPKRLRFKDVEDAEEIE